MNKISILTIHRSIGCIQMIQLSCLHRSDLFDCNQSIVCFRPKRRARVKFSDFYHLVSFALPPYYPVVAHHTLHFMIIFSFAFLLKKICFFFVAFVSVAFQVGTSSFNTSPCFYYLFFVFHWNLLHVVNTITFYSKLFYTLFEIQFLETDSLLLRSIASQQPCCFCSHSTGGVQSAKHRKTTLTHTLGLYLWLFRFAFVQKNLILVCTNEIV